MIHPPDFRGAHAGDLPPHPLPEFCAAFAGGGGQHRVEILQLLFIDRGERDADVAVAIGDHAYAALFEQVLSRAMPMVAS